MRSTSLLALLVAILAGMTSACSSGGGGGCSVKGGTTLAPEVCPPTSTEPCFSSPWPKFRRDAANTGRSPGSVVAEPSAPRRLFPPEGQTIQAIAATPVLGSDRILVASTDGNVYVIDYGGIELNTQNRIDTFGAVAASPLLGRDGTIFVASGDGSLVQYEADGEPRHSTGVGGFISASPNIGSDGTIYIASTTGGFSAVCPNGRFKFQPLVITPSESTAAVTEDPEDEKDRIIVFAHQNGEVRSIDLRGRQRWSFFASPAGVQGAVVLDLSSDTVFVADLAGRVFAVDLFAGSPRPAFDFRTDARILASMALGRDAAASPTLYAADEPGRLYALDRSTGARRWTFETGGVVRSSPAVSSGGDNDVVILAADVADSRCASGQEGTECAIVFAIADLGGEPEVLWSQPLPSPVGTSSPSIGADGSVYIGAQDGVLYTIAQG